MWKFLAIEVAELSNVMDDFAETRPTARVKLACCLSFDDLQWNEQQNSY